MPKGKAKTPKTGKRWLITAIAFLALGGLPMGAMSEGVVTELSDHVPDQVALDLMEQLHQLETLLITPAMDLQPNAALIDAAALSSIVRSTDFSTAFEDPRPTTARPVELTRFNMRLALTPLAQAFGADDNSTVIAAQTTADGTALVIQAGDATFVDIQAAIGATQPGILTLTQPLIIMNGASLTLTANEVVNLSRPDGAFIVNFGHLELRGGMIAVVGDANPLSRVFNPFVTTAGAGTLNIQSGQFIGLGFGDTLKFSGFSVMRSVLQIPDRASRIENAVFTGIISVSISGDADLLLRGNRFHDMRGPSLILSRTKNARVLSNLFYGVMPTNAIRLESGSDTGLIAGNIILGGERAGIVVRSDSPDATISHNIVWNRDGGGIVLVSADCARVYENLLIGNQQKGIEVRDSLSTILRQNTVFSNESAGIWVSDQPIGAQTEITGNTVSFNGAGLAGANTALLLMDGNDFSAQYQQFLSGDLALLTPDVARDMRGVAPFVLASGGPFAAQIQTPEAATLNDTGACSD
jgi:mannuronan 5-epimerase